MHRIVTIAVFVWWAASAAHGVTFTENFDGVAIDPDLTVSSSAGFTYSLTGGEAIVDKADGTGDGQLSFNADFAVVGDFTATVFATRVVLTGNGEAGISIVGSADDIFFLGDPQINANIFGPPSFGSQITANSTSQVTFRIRRVGQTLFEEFDAGSGFQTLHSATHANFAVPFRLGLFLIQEFGSTNAHSVKFDNFTITADAFSFCPTTPLMCRTAEKSILLVKKGSDPSEDKLIWKWTKGQATSQAEFGDPINTTDYRLCVYTGATPTLLSEVQVAADTSKWSQIAGKGYKYKDKGGTASGVTKIVLKGSGENKAKALLKGKGGGLPDPTLGSLPLPVTAQLVNSGTSVCFGATYDTADVIKNDPDQFKAKAQ